MPTYNVVLVQPPQYVQSMGLDDLGRLLCSSLRSLGLTCTYQVNRLEREAVNIVLGYHLLTSPELTQAHVCIAYQLEQLSESEGWWSPTLRARLEEAAAIWDYSLANIAFLGRLGVSGARHVPIGYHQDLEVIADIDPDIDVLFYGSVNARRRAVLAALEQRCVVRRLHDCYGSERDGIIARSRVVLNIHYYAAALMEEPRISFLLNNRRCVVTEESAYNPYPEGVVAAPYNGLVDACLAAVRAPELRAAVAERGYQAHRQRPMSEHLRAAIAFDIERLEQALSRLPASHAIEVRTHGPSRRSPERPTPLVSLCMIVRDEQEFLPGCLESVRPHVDQMIVVDTGSRDGTRAVAEAAGAVVVEHAWRDDFAAARNAALAAATGDWILVLDADERLHLPPGADFRGELRQATWDAALLPLYDAIAMDEPPDEALARVTEPPAVLRVFRRTPGLWWEGVVHETVSSWVAGRDVAYMAAPIIHYGYVPSVHASRGKTSRNIRLLRLRVEAALDDFDGRVRLAEELWRAGELAEARHLVQEAWQGMLASGERYSPDAWAQAASTFALVFCGAADLDAALASLDGALARARSSGAHPNLHFLRGVALEGRARQPRAEAERRDILCQALEAFRDAVSRRGSLMLIPTIAGVTSWLAHMRAGSVLLQLGRPADALAAFDAALVHAPKEALCAVGRAESLLRLDRVEEAYAALDPHMMAPIADACVVGADICVRAGQVDDARVLLEHALGAGGRPALFEPHRIARMRELCRAVSEV